ncbi:basic proline-rich protein-like [Onychostruthus taczanowskii]|uniref:basic proline-rich protein-like n=1 Tax=Onychostruthus taczanowskii TaxID=356909 RepID=UPI001B800C1A|nr:basic proline-rich protein-like [Onychostruthus taczanowskii]
MLRGGGAATRAGGGARRPSRPSAPGPAGLSSRRGRGRGAGSGCRHVACVCVCVRVCPPSPPPPRPGLQRSPGVRGKRPARGRPGTAVLPQQCPPPPCPCPPLLPPQPRGAAGARRPPSRVPPRPRLASPELARGSSCVSFDRWNATPDPVKCIHSVSTPGEEPSGAVLRNVPCCGLPPRRRWECCHRHCLCLRAVL